MKNLITISEDKTITAKELYSFLGLNPAHYARWTNKNILENQFATENVDFAPFTIQGEWGGQATTDYELTIEFAKKLCMVSKSAKGEQARNYFIEVEKRWLQQEEEKVTPSCMIADQKVRVMKWLEETEAREQLQSKVAELQEDIALIAPKAEFYDNVINLNCFMDFADAAKTLAIKRFGRNNLIDFLRSKNIIMKDRRPYQQYVERGYFKQIEQTYDAHGETRLSYKTVISNKGLDYIRKLILTEQAQAAS